MFQETNVFIFWEQLYVMSVFILAYTIDMISYSISGNKEINLIDTKTIQQSLEPPVYPGTGKHCWYLGWEADSAQASIGSYTDTNNIQIAVSVCALIILQYSARERSVHKETQIHMYTIQNIHQNSIHKKYFIFNKLKEKAPYLKKCL